MSNPTLPRERPVQLWLPLPDPPPIADGQFVYETWLRNVQRRSLFRAIEVDATTDWMNNLREEIRTRSRRE